MEAKVDELMKMINEETNTESILKAFKESEIKESSKIIEFVEKFVEVKKGESNKLLNLIEDCHCDVEVKDNCGSTLLHWASYYGYLEYIVVDLNI